MVDAKRDENRVPVLIGTKPDGSIAPLQIDEATGRVLVSIIAVSDEAPVVRPVEVRDENRVPVIYGVDANGDPQSMLIDNRNNGLWTNVTIE